MSEEQWRTLTGSIIPKVVLDIEPKMHEFKILSPLLWDLINQSFLMPDGNNTSTSALNMNFVLRFLIRNLSRDSIFRDKSSLSLVSILCLQSQAHQLRPRISAIDPSLLSDSFKGDLTLVVESTAKFSVNKHVLFIQRSVQL